MGLGLWLCGITTTTRGVVLGDELRGTNSGAPALSRLLVEEEEELLESEEDGTAGSRSVSLSSAIIYLGLGFFLFFSIEIE